MNDLNKKQLLIGGLILLFAINLAALGTLIYQNYQRNQQEQIVNDFQPANRPGHPGRTNLPSGRSDQRPSGKSMDTMEPGSNLGTGRRFDKYVREQVKLDEQQYRQYRELMGKTRQEQRNIAMKLSEKRNQLMQELAADEPDQQKLEELASDIGALHRQLKINTIDHFNAFKSICRPDQMDSLRQLMRNMSHHPPHQPGHNRPQGGRGRNRN